MRRVVSEPRPNWQEKVEQAGLIWHSGEQVYWNESAFYEFTAQEIEVLETATNELERMTLAAAQHIIDNRLYARLAIPPHVVPLIESSWEAEPPSLYGRFDLAYDGVNPPKLLEYNADTPTSLLEAAVIQWHWLQDRFPGRDQFNSIHERLIALWKELTPYLPGGRIDFCSMDDREDGMTVTYLQDTAQQAGLASSAFPIAEIGWDGRSFVGPDNSELGAVFKLYPWEWMVREEFGRHIPSAATLWIEPPWKMLLSNKALLVVLWELYPDHPNLLPAYYDADRLGTRYVRKPKLAREGANVVWVDGVVVESTPGDYGAEGSICQALAPLPRFGDDYVLVGSWLIDGTPAGIGLREDDSRITRNTSRFVPHYFTD